MVRDAPGDLEHIRPSRPRQRRPAGSDAHLAPRTGGIAGNRSGASGETGRLFATGRRPLAYSAFGVSAFGESWFSKFGQADEWSFCLRAARMAREQERR